MIIRAIAGKIKKVEFGRIKVEKGTIRKNAAGNSMWFFRKNR
jgi:hypothetical protein